MVGRRLCLLLVACALALSACDVDGTVTIAMRHNGSGVVKVVVALDRDAVRAARIGGGTLEQRVRVDDLPRAGWRVSHWIQGPNGDATLVARKVFHAPDEISSIVHEISGPKGPLRGFGGLRRASTFSTHWRINGVVDLSGVGVNVADDPALVANLTNERVDIPQVEARLNAELAHLHLHVVTILPHEGRREATATLGHRTAVAAVADDTDFNRVALLVAGIALGTLALVILVVGERRARRRRGSVASGNRTP